MKKCALYRHWNAGGVLLYIGQSLTPVHRLGQHVRRASWAHEITKITIEWFDSKALAKQAEKNAIRVELPRHNIDLTHQSIPSHLCIPIVAGRGPPVPLNGRIRWGKYCDKPPKHPNIKGQL